jgi:hypothetical protein
MLRCNRYDGGFMNYEMPDDDLELMIKGAGALLRIHGRHEERGPAVQRACGPPKAKADRTGWSRG